MEVALVVVALFVALTAVGGGVAMALGVDSNVDPAWLEGTPFRSYRVPGVLLAGLVGGSALAAAVALFLDDTVGAGMAVIAGAILAGWITAEVRMLNQPDAPTATEILYFAVGLAMVGLGLALAIG